MSRKRSQLALAHLEVLGLGVWLVQKPRQVDVQKGRNVTEVEQTDMTKVDRFLIQHIWRNHPHRNHVPRRPHGFPLGNRGDGESARESVLVAGLEERESERRPLEKPQRVTRGGVHPALDRAKVRVREQGDGVPIVELFKS